MERGKFNLSVRVLQFTLKIGRQGLSLDVFGEVSVQTEKLTVWHIFLSIVGLGIKVPEIPEDALEYGEGNMTRTTQLVR